jgi:hypothetical protein
MVAVAAVIVAAAAVVVAIAVVVAEVGAAAERSNIVDTDNRQNNQLD